MVQISYKPEFVKIGDMFEYVRSNEWVLQLPSFQRTYVWGDEEIVALMQSISWGHPIGTIMLWEVKSESDDFAARIRPSFVSQSTEGRRRFLIIDGQQRLVSLLLLASNWSLEVGPYNVRRGPISLDLQTMRFQIGRKGINLSEVLQAKLKWTNELTELKNKYRPFDKLEMVVDKLLNYKLSFFILEAEKEGPDTLREMVDLFIKTNRAGQRISNVELMLSYAAGVLDQKLSSVIRKWYDELQKLSPSLEIQPMIRYGFGAGLRLKQSEIDVVDKFKKAVDTLRNQRNVFGESVLISTIEEAFPYLRFTVITVNEIIGKAATELLPSQLSLIPLAKFFLKNRIDSLEKLQDEDRRRILAWLTLVNFHGYYSASASTRLQKDIDSIEESEDKEYFPLEKLLKNIEYYRKGATKIDQKDIMRGISEDVTKRPARSFLFLLYALLCLREASDWVGNKISALRAEELHKHHIFPRECFTPKGGVVFFEEDDELAKMVSGLGNITLINPEKNQEIGGNTPEKYLKNIDGDELERHFIPRNHWNVNDFSKFCEERVILMFNYLKSSPLSLICGSAGNVS